MPMLIKQKTVNEYKELLKNPTIFLKEKEEFIKKYPQFNTKLKQDNFENQTNYFEYQIFNFLYTVFEDNHEFTKNFDILLQELEKCKNIDNISSIFCLFLFMQWWKIEENVYLDSINKLLDFLIKKKIIQLFFSSKVWQYQYLFEKANNEIIDKLIKDISNLFNDETIYSDNFLTSLDFDFFIKNKKNEQYLVYLKNILVLFDNFLIKENEELFKKSHIINKLNHIFIKLNQCIELKNLFNEEEKSLFNTVRNKIDDATKNNLNSKNPNKKLVNKNISHQQKQINNQNSILKKIEELFLNLSSLFKTLDVNNINPELKKSIIEYFSSVSINNFCSQISFEEIIRSFNEVKDLKSKLKDDFMLLIDINNLSLISNIPYVLLLPSFTRFEVLISQLLISKKICKIEKNDSMISRINEIVNYLDKKNNLLKTKYTAFFKFLKFCFYDTDGFNLRNIYNHEENCEQKYCLNLDKNNTSKFLIALLLYLLNLSI